MSRTGLQPLAIDLFCGIGGWTEGLLAEGYTVIGFDNERHEYGEAKYPGQLVIQDVLTLHGSQFKDAALIVASPPCQEYSYMSMPWTRAKAIAAEYRSGVRDVTKLTALFDACFRIQREASEAAGRHIPLVVENVKGAQPWVGRAAWHFGSFYLWGDIPALMPITIRRVMKTSGLVQARDGHSHTRHLTNQSEHDRYYKSAGQNWSNYKRFGEVSPHYRLAAAGIKQHGSGREWFDNGIAAMSSNSGRRKAASAKIAKIPFSLAQHIARSWKP